jgi:hypothetical protein
MTLSIKLVQGNSKIEIGGVSNVESIDAFFFARNFVDDRN